MSEPVRPHRPWHSRAFRPGLLVTLFLLWVTADSFLFLSRFRTIHRGSLWDYSGHSTIPAGTPDESGSLELRMGGGALTLAWYDRLMSTADYVGSEERIRRPDDLRTIWLPRIRIEEDAVLRTHALAIPTWTILATWLAAWSALLRRSVKRHRSAGPTSGP